MQTGNCLSLGQQNDEGLGSGEDARLTQPDRVEGIGITVGTDGLSGKSAQWGLVFPLAIFSAPS